MADRPQPRIADEVPMYKTKPRFLCSMPSDGPLKMRHAARYNRAQRRTSDL